MLNHPDILKVRIENNNGSTSEVINLSYRKIYCILYKFINVNSTNQTESFEVHGRICAGKHRESTNQSTTSQSTTSQSTTNQSTSNINKSNFHSNIRILTQKCIDVDILIKLSTNQINIESMNRDKLRSFLTNSLHCKYSIYANVKDLRDKIREYVIAYRTGTLYSGNFNAYCDHKIVQTVDNSAGLSLKSKD